MAQTNTQLWLAGAQRVGDQRLDRTQPRAGGLVVGPHAATQHHETVVLGQGRGYVVTLVTHPDVEFDPALGEPVPEKTGRAGAGVLNDEKSRSHASKSTRLR